MGPGVSRLLGSACAVPSRAGLHHPTSGVCIRTLRADESQHGAGHIVLAELSLTAVTGATQTTPGSSCSKQPAIHEPRSPGKPSGPPTTLTWHAGRAGRTGQPPAGSQQFTLQTEAEGRSRLVFGVRGVQTPRCQAVCLPGSPEPRAWWAPSLLPVRAGGGRAQSHRRGTSLCVPSGSWHPPA